MVVLSYIKWTKGAFNEDGSQRDSCLLDKNKEIVYGRSKEAIWVYNDDRDNFNSDDYKFTNYKQQCYKGVRAF